MKTSDNKLNDKLKHLVSEGLSVEDAAECLGLDIDSAKLALNANDVMDDIERADDVTELIKLAKPKALKALINIGLNSKIENVSARVAALRSIAEYEDVSSNVEKDKINEIYRKMQEVSQKYDEELTLAKSKGDSTSVVIINENNKTITTPGFKEKISEHLNNPDELVTI